MIKRNIQAVAKKQGITTAYQLQMMLGVSPSVAARLWKGQGTAITDEMLNLLCIHLNCLPSDLFVFSLDSHEKQLRNLTSERVQKKQSKTPAKIKVA